MGRRNPRKEAQELIRNGMNGPEILQHEDPLIRAAAAKLLAVDMSAEKPAGSGCAQPEPDRRPL